MRGAYPSRRTRSGRPVGGEIAQLVPVIVTERLARDDSARMLYAPAVSTSAVARHSPSPRAFSCSSIGSSQLASRARQKKRDDFFGTKRPPCECSTFSELRSRHPLATCLNSCGSRQICRVGACLCVGGGWPRPPRNSRRSRGRRPRRARKRRQWRRRLAPHVPRWEHWPGTIKCDRNGPGHVSIASCCTPLPYRSIRVRWTRNACSFTPSWRTLKSLMEQ